MYGMDHASVRFGDVVALDDVTVHVPAGRVVAVVSHVDALKQAIAERIEVRRRGDGSSTLTVRA